MGIDHTACLMVGVKLSEASKHEKFSDLIERVTSGKTAKGDPIHWIQDSITGSSLSQQWIGFIVLEHDFENVPRLLDPETLKKKIDTSVVKFRDTFPGLDCRIVMLGSVW